MNTHRIALTVLACSTLGGCIARTPGDSSGRAGTSAEDEGCRPPPESDPPALRPAQIEALAGKYALTVVGTQGVAGDTVVRGELELWRADSAHAHNHLRPEDGRVFPLAGASDIDLKRVAPVTLAYSPDSRDRDRPGVQVRRNGSMWFGNAFGPVFTADAGVLFDRLRIDDGGFRGEWREGGLSLVNGVAPAGYFCAIALER